MTVRSRVIVGLASLIALVSTAAPASAQSDTEPPTLVSLAVSPAQIDASTGAQTITVSAVITDNLSGICNLGECQIGSVGLSSPTAGQRAQSGSFKPSPDGSYTATVTFPQYVEEGVWSDWSIKLVDRVGNRVTLGESQLLALGINAAVGVGSFKASYPRSFGELRLSPRDAPSSANGSLKEVKGSPCTANLPLVLQRRTAAGWKKLAQTYASRRLTFKFEWAKGHPGKYRVIAAPIGLGTPRLTTCLRASVVAKSESTPHHPTR